MIQKALGHPIFYLFLSTLSFAVATLPFTPTGFFVIFGVGLLGVIGWRVYKTVDDDQKELLELRRETSRLHRVLFERKIDIDNK